MLIQFDQTLSNVNETEIDDQVLDLRIRHVQNYDKENEESN